MNELIQLMRTDIPMTLADIFLGCVFALVFATVGELIIKAIKEAIE